MELLSQRWKHQNPMIRLALEEQDVQGTVCGLFDEK